jgi:hypothetical protein
MDGFQQQTQHCFLRQTRQQYASVALTLVAVCFGLCLTSGCAMTRNVWKHAHNATCGETTSQCRCSCGDCGAGAHIEHEAFDRNRVQQPSSATTQVYPASPLLPEGSRPVEPAVRPQAAIMNGVPGTWIPSPQQPAHAQFENQAAVPEHNPMNGWPVSESYGSGPSQQMPVPDPQEQWPAMQIPGMRAPEPAPQDEALKEYRTQLQVLTEQISLMKNAQDSMKVNQQTLQESQAREILELKLQHATADRDRLQRERELEQQLEKQRQRELATIDSLSQIVEGVLPAPTVRGAAPVPVPRSATQARPVQSMSSQQLPTVDESL